VYHCIIYFLVFAFEVDSLNNEQDDDIISNISDDSALKSSVAGNSLASKKKRNMSMTGSAAEPVPFDKVIEYFVFARERFVMDQKYFAKMAEEQKLMEMAAKRKRRLNQMDDARKMMLEFSRDVSKKKKDEDNAREKERKEREENGGGGGDDESLKSASTASSATSQTNSQTASTESISIAKLKRNRFMFMKKEVARVSEKEMEVFPDLYWFKLTIQHPEFFECLKELPLMKDKLCTRDELVQFAKICTELAPYTLKAKDRLKKKREDLMNKKALRGKRFVENRAADKDKKNTPMDTEEELAIKAKEEYRRLLSSGLAEEALKRKKRLKAAKKRRKRREKAWLYAHQHMFIKLAGKPAFCVVCRDKMDMQWLDSQEIAEKKWKDDWESTLAHNLNSFQSIAKQLVEDDFMKELEKKKNAISSSQGSDQLSSVSSLPEAPGSYLLPSQMKFDSDAESINSGSTKIVDIKEEVSDPSTKNEVSGTKSSIGESEANSEKNTTLSNSGRSNFMKGLSSKFSKSFSGLSSDGKASKEVESTSLKSESSGYTNAQDDTNTAEKSKPLGDDNNDDDLSRVSESKSEVSREGDSKFIRSGVGSALSGNTHDAKDDDSSKDEIFYAGASEYSGDLGALKDPDDIDQLKEFAAMGNVKTKGRGKNLRVDRGRTRRKGIVKAPIPLPDYMIEAGLAAIDPNGLKHSAAPTVIAPVVQTEEQIQKSKQVLSKKKSSIVNDSDDGSVDPARLTVFDKFPHEILLKVWNYDFEDKGDFLGYVLIPNEFIANPTKGIRKFPLLTDPSLVKPSGAHLALHGDIFCKLVPTRKADVRLNKQKPATNKMESFNENGNNSDSDSEVSSLASQSCRRKVAVSKAGTEPIKVAVSTPEPPKNMLQRFMSVKKVNTTKVMIESQEEERAIAADKEANDKKKAEEDLEFQGPCCWKFQIFKGVKLTAIDRIEKSSPIIEVCWKGNSTKKNDIVYEKDFQCVGYTSVKKNTLDPDWKGDDSAIFEFPPVWTSAPLPGRGESLKDTLKTGGYVSKNRVPADDPNKVRKFRSSVLMKLSSDDQASLQESLASSLNNPSPVAAKPVNKLSLFKRAVSAVKLTNRLNGHEIDNLEDKMAFKTKVRKALVEAEEVERRCMAREERRIHIHFREVATEIEAPFLAEQKLFEKNFSRLMQHLQSAPSILGRVRFLMSHLMKGGGTCTMCEDPATHRNVEVYAIPILYEEDEDELNRQVQVMLGRQHNSIIQILNYSVHQILGFSMRGHASLNERVAVVVCNNEPSVSLLEHIKQNYYSFTDADLRLALMQITNALMSVHRDGLVHRNIHPDAIQVKIKGKVKFGGEGDNNENDEDSEDDSDDDSDDDDLSAAAASVATKQSEADSIGSNTTSSKSLRNRPVYVLEDFWFLHNPRKSGCEYSMGRADWGNANTLPPEALNGNIISDKSDIWGLGVSVYMWATRGLALNVQDGQKFDFNEIAKNLPLKWGPWVLSFLRMCLERNPKYRASAHDLYQFLVIAKPLGNP
jgi:serine/threonine protein kinase